MENYNECASVSGCERLRRYYSNPIRIKYQKPSVFREKKMGLWSSSSRIMRALQKK